MREGLRKWVRRGLGDRRTISLGLLLIVLGVVGKILLVRYANIETVFVASLVAGSVLGRWWTFLVPLSIAMLLQLILWGGPYAGHALETIFGISFFVVTGFLFVGLVGRGLRPRVLFRVGSVALLTTVSIPLTIAWDLWTDIGEWYFLARPAGVDFATVLWLQIPFTLYHVLSSLIFVPLFGSIFLMLHHHVVQAPTAEAAPPTGRTPEDSGETDGA